MTPAFRETLLAFAQQWERVATAAAEGAHTMAVAGVPIERCHKARDIMQQALELALQLEDLARAAAPMPARDP